MHVQGDIGGIGISRLRFQRSDAGPITAPDVNTAAAAVQKLFLAANAYIPSIINIVCMSTCDVYDAATGLVQGPITVGSLPATIVGEASGTYAAGVGARLNWKTATISGRRLLKGCTYYVPLAPAAFMTSGAVAAGVVTALDTAAAAYLSAMSTGNLVPVVWHRPKKGTQAGGLTGAITAYAASSTPAGLRSRRS
jgi:hypothetical protein